MKRPLLIRRIVGTSMMPTFRPDGLVIAWRFGALKPGDIVILMHEGIEKIKRIEHMQGDQLFLRGDNIAASTDSRHFGWVDRQSVLARIIWPRVTTLPTAKS